MVTMEKDVRIRWAIRRDLPQILLIDTQTGERPWQEEELLRLLRNKTTIGVVAEDAEKTIQGFMIYDLAEDNYYIHQLAVRQEERRCGVGKYFVNWIKAKLKNGGKRKAITIDCRDTNLGAHLFLRSQGFKAIQVFRNFYADELVPGEPPITEDAYRFEYKGE